MGSMTQRVLGFSLVGASLLKHDLLLQQPPFLFTKTTSPCSNPAVHQNASGLLGGVAGLVVLHRGTFSSSKSRSVTGTRSGGHRLTPWVHWLVHRPHLLLQIFPSPASPLTAASRFFFPLVASAQLLQFPSLYSRSKFSVLSASSDKSRPRLTRPRLFLRS